MLHDLRARGQTLATAESLTAGLIAATVAAVPGASDVLRGGLAAYASDVKSTVLGVPADLLASQGVISAGCARAMATRARVVFEADWAVAATGVAGPDAQEGKPVGTVYVAAAGPGVVRVQQLDLTGTRQQIRWSSVESALSLLHDLLAVSPGRGGRG
ncbi:MAG: CinA family protein [Nocardioidaceae bacterium]